MQEKLQCKFFMRNLTPTEFFLKIHQFGAGCIPNCSLNGQNPYLRRLSLFATTWTKCLVIKYRISDQILKSYQNYRWQHSVGRGSCQVGTHLIHRTFWYLAKANFKPWAVWDLTTWICFNSIGCYLVDIAYCKAKFGCLDLAEEPHEDYVVWFSRRGFCPDCNSPSSQSTETSHPNPLVLELNSTVRYS